MTTERRRRQVIRLGARETHYEGWCARCLDDPEPRSIGVQWMRVEGRLPLSVDAGVTHCPNGHPIALRRSARLTSAA